MNCAGAARESRCIFMKKRVLSVVLAVMFVLPLFSFVSFAYTSIIDSGECGKNLTWKLDSNYCLTISGKGEMNNYSVYNPSPWKKYSEEQIKKIVVEDGVTSIGNYAFSGCKKATSITISDKVRSIGKFSFNQCGSITSIDLPSGILFIPEMAFAGCSSLASITIPNGVSSIGFWSFSGCTSLLSVNIPDSVTKIEGCAFFGCNVLYSITIPNSVTTISERAFCGCQRLPSVIIPDSVTSLGESAFDGCFGLTSVTIPGSLSVLPESVFSGCSSLNTVIIPEGVTSIEHWAFSHCDKLCAIILPVSLKSVGTDAFSECKKLKNVYYTGSFRDRRLNLIIDEPNDRLIDANWHYDSDHFKVTDIFTDVEKDSWYESAVQYAYDNGIFSGMTPTSFAPGVAMTRAMLVSVLYRLDGTDYKGNDTFLNYYKDVPKYSWYSVALAWATQNRIVSGVGDRVFNPDGNITREQMAAILYRYAVFKGYDTSASANLSKFPDADKISSWAIDSMKWAVAEGLISGNGINLDPRGNATRAQVASILMRYCKKYA